MQDKEFLTHLYTAAALIGLLAGRGSSMTSHKEDDYVRRAKRMGRAMTEEKADEGR